VPISKQVKNILLVSFYFPPYSHPGVQRVLKFAKYLPLYGYHPLVLTCGNMPWKDFDFDTYDSEVKNRIQVRKVDAPRFSSLGHSFLGARFMDKLILRFEALLFEDRLDWALGARKEALKLVERDSITLVVTSGPPQSVHFLGYHIKKKTATPWVIDFRDPMVKHIPTMGLSRRDRLLEELKKRTLFLFYERMFLRAADFVVTATEAMAQDFKSMHPGVTRKMTTITNGFDEQDFAGVAPQKTERKHFTMVYTGRFWATHPLNFLEGLRRALRRDPGLKNELRVLFVGEYDGELTKLLASFEFLGIVKTPGAMRHRDAISYQLGSDVNLLILSVLEEAGSGYIFTGKIFEYLRARRPILAIVPNCVAREFIEENKLGYTVHPTDHEGIADAIIFLHRRWKTNTLRSSRPSEALLAQYERRHLTEQLAEIFDRCSL